MDNREMKVKVLNYNKVSAVPLNLTEIYGSGKEPSFKWARFRLFITRLFNKFRRKKIEW